MNAFLYLELLWQLVFVRSLYHEWLAIQEGEEWLYDR